MSLIGKTETYVSLYITICMSQNRYGKRYELLDLSDFLES